MHELEDDDEYQEDDFFLGTLSLDSVQADGWMTELSVNGRRATFKLDTGAAVTTVGRDVVGDAKL